MRKRIIDQNRQKAAPVDQNWLDVQHLAVVEITSEDEAYPVEAALLPGGVGSGWRAAQAGEQTIRLLFDEMQNVTRIHLVFHEERYPRTQEFVLRWSPDAGQSYKEIVRQQYNFNPPDMTDEVEEYTVVLAGVTVLELKIIPDTSGGEARASAARFRVA